MTVIPQQSRVVIEPIVNDSPILVPDLELKDDDGNKIHQPKRWRVVAVGSGRILDSGVKVEIPLNVGDEVQVDMRYAMPMFPPFVSGKTLLVVDYAGVFAKIEREPGEAVTFNPPPSILRAVAVPPNTAFNHVKVA